MKLNIGICAASIVVASSLTLIGAANPAQTAAGPAAQAPAAAAAPALPLWAYPVAPPRPRPADGAARPAPPPADPTLLTQPDSKTPGLTKQQINDIFVVPDWYPEAHPKMPQIVAEGRKPDVGACGHCHLPTGYGRPENQSIAGLPAAYILEQLSDFKNDLRHSSEPRMGSVNLMVKYSKSITPEEAKEAADYFSSIKPVKWIRVVEADTVPVTHPAGGMLVADQGTEPIGERVIEVSENYEQTEMRSTKSGFVAYVPKGSLKTGEDLVKTGGGGKTMACIACHGPNLKGVGNIPSIAGRSPSQITRQLMDFQSGARNGAAGAMMKMPVAKLTNADIVAITGYLASLEP
jgi:cytochrome c553